MLIAIAMSNKQYVLDAYVLDTLMRDLVGHDLRTSAFLVYLSLLLLRKQAWPVSAMRSSRSAPGFQSAARRTRFSTSLTEVCFAPQNAAGPRLDATSFSRPGVSRPHPEQPDGRALPGLPKFDLGAVGILYP